MELKIDRATLPKDGQKVRFNTRQAGWQEGMFCEGEDIFMVGFEESSTDWYFAWHVDEWEPLDTPSTPPVKEEEGSDAVEFANWIAEQEYNYDFDSVSGHVWYKKNHMGVYSTNQLYQLFKTRNK